MNSLVAAVRSTATVARPSAVSAVAAAASVRLIFFFFFALPESPPCEDEGLGRVLESCCHVAGWKMKFGTVVSRKKREARGGLRQCHTKKKKKKKKIRGLDGGTKWRAMFRRGDWRLWRVFVVLSVVGAHLVMRLIYLVRNYFFATAPVNRPCLGLLSGMPRLRFLAAEVEEVDRVAASAQALPARGLSHGKNEFILWVFVSQSFALVLLSRVCRPPVNIDLGRVWNCVTFQCCRLGGA